jgi:glutamine synthetase
MASKEEILARCASEHVRFLRLVFTDIHGTNKNVEIPENQFGKALDGDVMFDGSSIEGYARIEESDMLLQPDLETFVVLPFDEPGGKVARILCDIVNPEGTPFAGCPRTALRRQLERAKQMGFEMVCGPEAEFFLFQRGPKGEITTLTHDKAAYFDLTPVDRGEDARRAIVNALERMGFEIEAAHHEVANGQHEIDFRYEHALRAADHITSFKFVVRKVALDFDLHATFLPKPIFGINGSGMHVHQSLFRDGANTFFDANAEFQLSDIARWYIGGLLEHARGMCAITNPLINSFKRLVPGYEAPTHIAWSERNRSPLCRVPSRRGNGTRVELRMPDPSCNPYLAFAAMLAAGLDGIERRIDPGPPVNKNIYTMSDRERGRLRIRQLPGDLDRALDALEKDDVIRAALGDHIFTHFVSAKRAEWSEYIAQVHAWELDRYLATY